MNKPNLYWLLEQYSKWLEKHHYLDSDWNMEQPRAIDEFMGENADALLREIEE